MQIGDIVQVNDLCTHAALQGSVGTVVETHIEEEWHSWLLAGVLTAKGVLRFREDTPQLEVV